jgi:hypothetical protein
LGTMQLVVCGTPLHRPCVEFASGWVLRLGFGVEHLLFLGWRGFGSDGQRRLFFGRCSLGERLLSLVAKG